MPDGLSNSQKHLVYVSMEPFRKDLASYTHITEIVRGLECRNWQVRMLAPIYGHHLPGMLGRLWKMIMIQARLLKPSTRPHALYMRMHFAATPAALWARIRGIPFVVEVNGPFADLFIAWPGMRVLAPVFRAMMAYQLRHASKVITVTPGLAEYINNQVGRSDAVVIPNGANVDIFHPKALTDIKLPSKYAVFFGTMAPWQGIDTLLAAITSAHWPEGVSCVFVGDGQRRTAVEKAAREMPHKVVYLGKLPADQLAGVVTGAVVGMVACEDVQGRAATGLFPLKLFETLACNVPVIATDFPGMADLVRNHNCGWIIEQKNPQKIAETVRIAVDDPQQGKAMGLRGGKVVREEHSWDCRAANTAEILKAVLASEGAADNQDR